MREGRNSARAVGCVIALFLAPIAVGSCAATTSLAPRRWHVAHNALVDPQGRTVVLRGMNLAGAHKSPPYFGFHQPADYARIRTDWGLDSVRFLVTWSAIEPSRGNYDDAYLNELDKRIGWAEDANVLVIVDMHQDLYGLGFGGDGAPRWTCDEQTYPHSNLRRLGILVISILIFSSAWTVCIETSTCSRTSQKRGDASPTNWCITRM